MINCKIELNLSRSKNCIISEISRTAAVADNPNANPPVLAMVATKNSATFQTNNAKRYTPVVTLSINDNIKFLENIKEGFRRTVTDNKIWNKNRTRILIACLFFQSKMVMLTMQKIILMSITCYWSKAKILMH